MEKIILFPGTIDSPFFLNEIEYIKKEFEIMKVYTYQGDKSKFDKISQKYNFTYEVIPNISLKSFFSLHFIYWFFSKDVVKEIKNNFSFNLSGIKKIFYMLYYGNFAVTNYIKLKKLLKNNNEKIYLYSFWLSRGAYSISYYKKKLDSKSLVNISRAHRYDLYEERNDLNYLPFRKFINDNLDKIAFISEDGREYFKEKYKFNSLEKYFVSRLGTENKLSLKKIIKNKNKICIASCSSIIQVKRLDLIIDILSQINIDFFWIHIGSGELEKEIKEYAIKKLKKDSYKFLGKLNNSAILQTYIDYDVDYFINMSDSEGVPVSIMEAISLGIPVIARNVGGNIEIVNHDNGLIIEKLTIDNIDNFFRLRIENEEKYMKISEKARDTWRNEYNSQKNYEKFIREIKILRKG